MLKLIKCEFLKLKRKPLVFISVFLSTLLPLAYAIFLADANTDVDATNNMMSGLFQLSAYLLLMPLLVILASNLLFEELDNDTLKNLVTIPVNRTKLVLSKMMVLLIFAIGFMAVGLSGLTAEVFFHGGTQIVLAGLTTYMVCMPLILIFGQIRGAYLGGSILAFFLGYSMMFFKGGILASIYPFSAALLLVGFDMSEYAGTTTAPNSLLAVIGVGIMVLWAVLLLVMSSNKKEMKARKQTKAKGRGKRAVRRKGR